MLEITNAEITYSEVILAVKGISIAVSEGGCVALLGGNGAGKSTTLKAVSGMIRAEVGRLSGGTILFNGQRIDGLSTEEIVRTGITHIMEGRRVLPHMTVAQNLVVGGHMLHSGRDLGQMLNQVYELIPRLADLRGRTSGYLSGGEQQMLVVGRALMSRPKLVLIDEPSLGLAPKMVEEVFEVLARLRKQGIALLIVEQNTRAALALADHGYVMENGRIVLEGTAEYLRSNEDVREFYLGLDLQGERKSFRNVKHYRRRKRWLG